MATKLIGVRLEEELLELKPEGMRTTDWIRECIHVWKLAKEGELKELLKKVEELKEAGEELRKCPNIDSLKRVADELEEATKALREYKRVVENLEWYGSKLYELKKELEKSLIHRPNLYQRSYEWDEV
ncbi:MAG: DUF342 domain-containing protein [Aquificae bacterium]|nr:DUF342 domain-containing protein [Aquificota bacterium]